MSLSDRCQGGDGSTRGLELLSPPPHRERRHPAGTSATGNSTSDVLLIRLIDPHVTEVDEALASFLLAPPWLSPPMQQPLLCVFLSLLSHSHSLLPAPSSSSSPFMRLSPSPYPLSHIFSAPFNTDQLFFFTSWPQNYQNPVPKHGHLHRKGTLTATKIKSNQL